MKRFYNQKYIITLVLCFTFLTGCATRKEIVQFKNDTDYLRSKIDTLSVQNNNLREKIEKLNSKITEFIQESNRQRADLLTEIGTLKEMSQYIDSKLEDNITQFNRVVNRSNPGIELQSSTTHPTSTSSPKESIDSIGSPKLSFDAQTLYNNAYLDLTRGDYKLALVGFNDFLKYFPENDLAVNAQYWIGECFYAQGLYHIAFDEFQNVIIRYPNGSKVPAALLKMGYSANKMGDKENAKKYLQMVIQKFPHSEEARLAKQQLETFNKN